MKATTRVCLFVATTACSLLLHSIPALADDYASSASGNLRPSQGQSLTYQSYVSNDPKDCKEVQDETVQFSGGGTVFVGADTWPSQYTKPMNLQCDKNYVMVTMYSKTSGGFGTALLGGGSVTNNGKAMCCPLKYHWVPATATS